MRVRDVKSCGEHPAYGDYHHRRLHGALGRIGPQQGPHLLWVYINWNVETHFGVSTYHDILWAERDILWDWILRGPPIFLPLQCPHTTPYTVYNPLPLNVGETDYNEMPLWGLGAYYLEKVEGFRSILELEVTKNSKRNKQVVEERNRWGRLRYELLVSNQMSHRHETYSVENIVNSYGMYL